MSSSADVETLRAGYAEFNKGDFVKAVSFFHESVEWVDAPELPGATTWRGHDGVLACWASWTDVWGELAMEPTDFVDAGGSVYLVAQTMRASGTGSGTPVEMTLWSVCSFANGKPKRVTFHLTEGAARQAAGLAP
jgi:ketosteroid isomerase-like protein